MIVLCSILAGLMAGVLTAPVGQQSGVPPPAATGETFAVNATASARPPATGTVTVPMTIHIDRYTPEFARVAMTDALKYRGYPGFLQALREAPPAGALEVAGKKFVIRWARQEPGADGRTISVVTEKPVFFVGSGTPDAKPTAGYEVAVVQLVIDEDGRGEGVMAAAARVKPLGTTGVQIDDYAATPLKLTATRVQP